MRRTELILIGPPRLAPVETGASGPRHRPGTAEVYRHPRLHWSSGEAFDWSSERELIIIRSSAKRRGCVCVWGGGGGGRGGGGGEGGGEKRETERNITRTAEGRWEGRGGRTSQRGGGGGGGEERRIYVGGGGGRTDLQERGKGRAHA